MASWASGYVTEIGYTHGYYRELNPQALAFAALARGWVAPGLDAQPIRVLELGCGQGISANIVAAANPHLSYTAVDFNPAHIVSARKLALRAGTPNVSFLELSFEELLHSHDGGEFDIILMHGIYTWVSGINRGFIRHIIKKFLRPGGMVYMSYNTFPGWAPVIPFRRVFTDAAADHGSVPIGERLDVGLNLFEKLREIGARSIAANPGIVERFERLKTQPKNYAAHEYLNGEWTIFHFEDVAKEMAEAKLGYATSANMIDHIDEINLTEEQRNFLREIKDTLRRESMRDLVVNQGFRKDIFLRGVTTAGGLTMRGLWENLHFILIVPPKDVTLEITGLLGQANLKSEIYEPLIHAFEQGACSVRDLISRCEPFGISLQQIQYSIVVLMAKGVLEIAKAEVDIALSRRQTDAFNGAAMIMAREETDLQFLASPVIGGGVAVDRISQLFLLAQRENLDPVQEVWGILKNQGQRLVKGETPLNGDEENLTELAYRYEIFCSKVVPKLRILGVC